MSARARFAPLLGATIETLMVAVFQRWDGVGGRRTRESGLGHEEKPVDDDTKVIPLPPRRRTELVCGFVAVLGGLINAFSDLLLRSGPVSGAAITHGFMATMPYEQVQTGALVGAALGIPMWLAVLVPLYALLKPAGPWRSVPAVVLLGYLFVLTATYHGVYAFYAANHQLVAEAIEAHQIAARALLAKSDEFEAVLGSVWFAAAALSSISLAAGIANRRSGLPWWSLFFLPVMSIVASVASMMLPAPVGGYIRPMAGTLVFTAFFVVVMWATRSSSL